MNKIVLLLGGNVLNRGIFLKCKEMGFCVFVIDWNEKPAVTGDKHYRLDIKDTQAIITQLKKDKLWDFIVFAYTSTDVAVCSVALINRELGLYQCDEKILKNALSKSVMTDKWKLSHLLNRSCWCFKEYCVEIPQLLQSKDLIIKPNASASSRGITILDKTCTLEEIETAFYKAKEESSDKKVVVEEFVRGDEMTIEMLGDMYGNVGVYAISLKRHSLNVDKNKIAIKLLYNCLDIKEQTRIANYAIQCYKALGLSTSLGHLEMIRKENGEFSPVEIGARSSGFILSDLVNMVSSRDYLKDLLAVYQGGRIPNGLVKQTEQAAMYFFYDFPSGFEIAQELNLSDFLNDRICIWHSYRDNLKKGVITTPMDSDNTRAGFEILQGDKQILTMEYIEGIESQMYPLMLKDKNAIL